MTFNLIVNHRITLNAIQNLFFQYYPPYITYIQFHHNYILYRNLYFNILLILNSFKNKKEP